MFHFTNALPVYGTRSSVLNNPGQWPFGPCGVGIGERKGYSAVALPSWARPDQVHLARHCQWLHLCLLFICPGHSRSVHGPCGAGQGRVWVSWTSAVAFSQELQKISPILKLPHLTSLIQGPRCWVCLEGQLVPSWFLVEPGLACLPRL